MFQVGASGHHFKDGFIGDVVASSHLQPPELWAVLRQRVQAAVSEPPAATNHHSLQHEAHVGRVLAQSARKHPQGSVDVQQLPWQPDGPPEPRIPSQVIPAAANPGTAAQLVRGQACKDL